MPACHATNSRRAIEVTAVSSGGGVGDGVGVGCACGRAPTIPGATTTDARSAKSSALVRNERDNVYALERRPAVKRFQLDEKRKGFNVGPETLEETARRGRRSTRCKQVVHHCDPIVLVECIGMDLERVRAVFERIIFREFAERQLSRLSHGNEARPDCIRERSTEHVAARLDSNDVVDLAILETVDKEIDRRLEALLVFEHGGNVAKEDPRDWKIGDCSNELLSIHGERGFEPGPVAPAPCSGTE